MQFAYQPPIIRRQARVKTGDFCTIRINEDRAVAFNGEWSIAVHYCHIDPSAIERESSRFTGRVLDLDNSTVVLIAGMFHDVEPICIAMFPAQSNCVCDIPTSRSWRHPVIALTSTQRICSPSGPSSKRSKPGLFLSVRLRFGSFPKMLLIACSSSLRRVS